LDKVLEIGGYAAAYCGRLLCREGADVVRIDGVRPPAWASDFAMDLYLHAGKRRLATDDTGLIAELAARADIVICESDTADALDATGFDTWQCGVRLAITPFGRTGPKRNWRATPGILLAMGGYTHIIGDPDRAPLTLPGHYVEFQAGAIGFAAATANRFSGRDGAIDLSLFETVMSLSQFTTVRYHCAGEIRARHGNDFYFVEPSELYACRDGWVYIGIVPGFWDAFTVFIDRPDLLIDDRFTTNELRVRNRFALHAEIAPIIRGWTRAELTTRADETRIPLGVVLSFAEVLADPHLAARAAWEPLTAAVEGSPAVRSPAVPFRINDTLPIERSLQLVTTRPDAGTWS